MNLRKPSMTKRLHRTQILLRPEQHAALARLAEGQSSISELVRQIIQEYLDSHSESVRWHARTMALERARKVREAILKDRGGKPIELDVAAMIHQMREERDAQLLSSLPENHHEDRD